VYPVQLVLGRPGAHRKALPVPDALRLHARFRSAVAALLAVVGLAGSAGAADAACAPAGTYATSVTGISSLVSFWELGDASGKSACDGKGANTGTYQGGYTLKFGGAISGSTNTAVGFNGTTANVKVASATSLNPTRVSVEAWVKPTSVTGTHVILDKEGEYLLQTVGSTLVARVWQGTSYVEATSPATAIVLSRWQHVVMTFDGQTLSVYRNGVLIASRAATQTLPSTTNPLYFASTPTASFFAGTLDEVALYSQALTAAQVEDHYDKGIGPGNNFTPKEPADLTAVAGSGKVTLSWPAVADDDLAGYRIFLRDPNGITSSLYATVDAFTTSFIDTGLQNGIARTYSVRSFDGHGWESRFASVPDTATPHSFCEPTSGYGFLIHDTASLASYWRLGETTGTTACDAIGANDGTYASGSTLGQTGALGSDTNPAASFDGISGAVNVPGTPGYGLNPSNGLTLELWLNPTTLVGQRPLIAKSGQYALRQVGDQLSFRIWLQDGSSSEVLTDPVLKAGTWQHVVATYDGTELALYRNGYKLKAMAAAGLVASTTNSLQLGTDGMGFFMGRLDEPAIYTTALRDSVVRTHFDNGTKAAPQLSVTGSLATAGTGWLNEISSTLTVDATDADSESLGTGVVSLRTVLDGQNVDKQEQDCSEGGCSAHLDSTFDEDTIPDGQHSLLIEATDGAGNVTTQAKTLKFDRSGPQVSLSGSLIDNHSISLDSGSYGLTVSATDAGSGVASIEILLGDQRQHFVSQDCASSGCALTDSWTLDTSGMADGQYMVHAHVVDQLGQARDRWIPFFIDRTAPKLSVSGSLMSSLDSWLSSGSYGVDMTSTINDTVSSPGVASIEVVIDGGRADYVEQTCTANPCTVNRSFSVDPSAYADGDHTLEAIARSWTGKSTTHVVEFKVDHSPPAISVSGELVDASDQPLADDSYDLHVHAVDPSSEEGSRGVESLTIALDDEVQASDPRDCDDGCARDLDWTLRPGLVIPGTHTVTVSAMSAGQETTRLIPITIPAPSVPAATGRFLARFVPGSDHIQAELHSFNLDGTDDRVVVPIDGCNGGCQPYDSAFALAPNGQTIAFSGPGGLWVDDGAENRRLVWSDPFSISQPRFGGAVGFAPDGKTVVLAPEMAEYPDSNFDIYAVDTEGATALPLAANPTWDIDPDLSPDGQHLAYESMDGLVVADADGNNPTIIDTSRLVPTGAQIVTPRFSPDGQSLTFTAHSRDTIDYQVFTVDIDGTNLHQLTHDASYKQDAVWYPDGRSIIYDHGPRTGVWRVPAYGGTPTQFLPAALASADGVVFQTPSRPHVWVTQETSDPSTTESNYSKGADITLGVSASDGAGIDHVEIRDGSGGTLAANDPDCAGGCPSEYAGTFATPVSTMSEGRHRLRARARSTAGKVGVVGWNAYIDRTAPGAPANIQTLDYDDATQDATVGWDLGVDPDLPGGFPGSATRYTRYRYQHNGGAWSDWAYSYDEAVTVPNATLSETLNFEFISVDAVGNESSVFSRSVAILEDGPNVLSEVDAVDMDDFSVRDDGEAFPCKVVVMKGGRARLEGDKGESNVVVRATAGINCIGTLAAKLLQRIDIVVCVKMQGGTDFDFHTQEKCSHDHTSRSWVPVLHDLDVTTTQATATAVCRPGQKWYAVGYAATATFQLRYPYRPKHLNRLKGFASLPCNEAGAWRYLNADVSSPSGVLGKSMRDHGETSPAAGFEAHHMIPSPLRKVVEMHWAQSYAYSCMYNDRGQRNEGIAPNEWLNGVWLRGPKLKKGDEGKSPTGFNTPEFNDLSPRLKHREYHRWVHTKRYGVEISARLNPAVDSSRSCNAAQAETILGNIKTDLETNQVDPDPANAPLPFRPADQSEDNAGD
jgi:hypothetical protein